MSQLQHPNVLKLIGAGKSRIRVDGVAEQNDTYYIVSELADHGEAYEFISASSGLKPEYARQLFSQIVSAVTFIHSKGIAHRDLKLENIFLDKQVTAKVADFGLMKAFAGPNFTSPLKTNCGTPNYMAPELFEKVEYAGPPVDVFALGQLLFLMRYG